MRALHASNPCYGSLGPAKERVGRHELPYDPNRRFIALSKLIGGVRGEKTFEHLENLRISDPSYGNLVPSSLAADRQAAADEALEEPEMLRQRTSSASGRPLRRILSDQAMYFEEEEEELSDEPYEPRVRHSVGTWCPPSPKRNPAYEPAIFSRVRRVSNESTEDDSGSLLSAARTSMERSSMERASNDTITSFLDNADGSASGEWSAAHLKEDLAGIDPPAHHGRKGKAKTNPTPLREGFKPEIA